MKILYTFNNDYHKTKTKSIYTLADFDDVQWEISNKFAKRNNKVYRAMKSVEKRLCGKLDCECNKISSMDKLTLKQFRHTREYTHDLSKLKYFCRDYAVPGYIYMNHHYIELVQKSQGKFCLMTEYGEVYSDDLAKLEEQLYNEWIA